MREREWVAWDCVQVLFCFLLDLVLRVEVAKSGLLASGLGLVWLVITIRTSFYCGSSIERVVMVMVVVDTYFD